MKRALSLILAVILLLGVFTVPASAVSSTPKISAKGAVVMDLTSGNILFESNSHDKLYPASTTKMLTAILVIENLSLGKTLTADSEVAGTGGSRLTMRAGEQISAKDALYAMMIGSCNDLAVLLAKAVSGSVEEFAKLMNQKALEIGCTGSNFVNPNGLHNENHYTTAYDMAVIARYCMQNSTFRDIVKYSDYSYTRGSGALNPGSTEILGTTNWLLNDTSHTMYVGGVRRTPKYDGCIGIKTGWTSQARGCCVSAATRTTEDAISHKKYETTILTVVMGSDGDSNGSYERFVDSILLLDWAFANFRTLTVMRMGTELGTLKVKKGEFNKVTAVAASDVYVTLEEGQSDSSITTKVNLDESIKAPFNQGTKCGTLDIFRDGTQVAQINVVTSGAVKEGGFLSNFGVEDSTAKKIFTTIITVILLVFLAFAGYIAYLKVKTERIKKRRAERAKARREAAERERNNDLF